MQIFKEAPCDVVLLNGLTILGNAQKVKRQGNKTLHVSVQRSPHLETSIAIRSSCTNRWNIFLTLNYHVYEDIYTHTQALCKLTPHMHTNNENTQWRNTITHTHIQCTRSKMLLKMGLVSTENRDSTRVLIYAQIWTCTWMYVCVTRQPPVDLGSQAEGDVAHTHRVTLRCC